MFLRLIGKIFLKITGWTSMSSVPPFKKYIFIAAPHTSNWDFLWGNLYKMVSGHRTKILIKKELFFFPLNLFLKKIGGIPVDRKKRVNRIENYMALFDKFDEFQLTIAPEGTRNLNERWKRGFIKIARATQVPVILSYVDYAKKDIGWGTVILPENFGTDEEIMDILRDFYSKIGAKYPKKFAVDKRRDATH